MQAPPTYIKRLGTDEPLQDVVQLEGLEELARDLSHEDGLVLIDDALEERRQVVQLDELLRFLVLPVDLREDREEQPTDERIERV